MALLRGVYGNIDTPELRVGIRRIYFNNEDAAFMQHIGGHTGWPGGRKCILRHINCGIIYQWVDFYKTYRHRTTVTVGDEPVARAYQIDAAPKTRDEKVVGVFGALSCAAVNHKEQFVDRLPSLQTEELIRRLKRAQCQTKK
jgi:hypothetical protein